MCCSCACVIYERFLGVSGSNMIYTMSAPKGIEIEDEFTYDKSLETDLVLKVSNILRLLTVMKPGGVKGLNSSTMTFIYTYIFIHKFFFVYIPLNSVLGRYNKSI